MTHGREALVALIGVVHVLLRQLSGSHRVTFASAGDSTAGYAVEDRTTYA